MSALTSSRLTTSTCIFGARQSFCDRWKWLWVTFQGTLPRLIHEGWRVLIIRTTMFTIVNQDQLLRQIKQNSKHDNNGFNQWLEILAVEDLPAKLRKSGEKRLEIQHDQWMRRWQLETAEQREHRLTQRRQCCPQEQRNRSLEYQGQYQGLPSVIGTERLHFRSQNISVRHGSCRSGKKRF